MRKILVVVDCQNDFIYGPLGTQEAQDTVAKIVAKIDSCGPEDVVLLTQDTHKNNYLKTHEGIRLPVVHCEKGTWGWNLPDSVNDAIVRANQRSKYVMPYRVEKSGFGSTYLMSFITAVENVTELDFDVVELVGFCTDICVISNAIIIRSHFVEKDVVVDASCCAGCSPTTHDTALRAMRMCQIDVVNYEFK